jgi:hypothetical protein
MTATATNERQVMTITRDAGANTRTTERKGLTGYDGAQWTPAPVYQRPLSRADPDPVTRPAMDREREEKGT